MGILLSPQFWNSQYYFWFFDVQRILVLPSTISWQTWGNPIINLSSSQFTMKGWFTKPWCETPAEQWTKNPGDLLYIGDDKLPSHIGIIVSHYKDPYESTRMTHGSCQGRVWFTRHLLLQWSLRGGWSTYLATWLFDLFSTRAERWAVQGGPRHQLEMELEISPTKRPYK